jgi:hypothetical protein
MGIENIGNEELTPEKAENLADTPCWLAKQFPQIGEKMPSEIAALLRNVHRRLFAQPDINPGAVDEITISRLMDNFYVCFFVRRDQYFPRIYFDETFESIRGPERPTSELMKKTTVREFLGQIDGFMAKYGLTIEAVQEKARTRTCNGVKEANLYLFPVFLEMLKLGYWQPEIAAP